MILDKNFEFQSKAKTLCTLEHMLSTAKILPMYHFRVKDWADKAHCVLDDIENKFHDIELIIRSSCKNEDQVDSSGAGAYDSVLNVRGRDDISSAIEKVISSYGHKTNNDDEVLVQAMASNVIVSGVAMTLDPEYHMPYYIINYTYGESTDGVTSGNENVFSFITIKHHTSSVPDVLVGLIDMLKELENITSNNALDVEFAITTSGPILFQVRPIIGVENNLDDKHFLSYVSGEVDQLTQKFSAFRSPHKDKMALYGLMPDWNPAEIIGVKPRPLAYSLYKELITDVNWASARFRYGYQDVRGLNLMYQFGGSPYICVPYSLQSFIPASIPQDIVNKVVYSGCSQLHCSPELHDKIEFSIIPTCYVPTMIGNNVYSSPAFSRLNDEQINCYLTELRKLTEHIVNDDGPFYADLKRLPVIEQEFERVRDLAEEDPLHRFRIALTKAKIVGEIFSGTARSAFIATAVLKSLEQGGYLSHYDVDAIIGSAHTVGKKLSEDFCILPKDVFLNKHGHVRPGTYDIRISRYDEEPDYYFDWSAPTHRMHCSVYDKLKDHLFMRSIQKAFDLANMNISSGQFIKFCIDAVEAREKVKYLYGGFVSESLRALSEWGDRVGVNREDLSFYSVTDFIGNPEVLLTKLPPELIDERRKIWELTQKVRMPSLMSSEQELLAHEVTACKPNFITRSRAEADVVVLSSGSDPISSLDGNIILIDNADPGYDWIFTHSIAGFITAYGGENSHMSIRAREFGMPAAIGIGASLMNSISRAKKLLLDCSARKIQILI
jgi:glutamine kinase